MSGHDANLDELMEVNGTDATDGIGSRGDHSAADAHDADNVCDGTETCDYRAIVAALDTIYTIGSNVATLVEAGKLDHGVIAQDRLERWLVMSAFKRVGTAAATLEAMGHELPEELKLDELVRAGALVAVPNDDISWDAIEEIAFSVLPGVRAFAKPLYWERWQEILGENAPRLPFM